MTADDDSRSESDNSDSRRATQENNHMDDTCTEVLEAIRSDRGWATRDGLADQLGLRHLTVDECLASLEASGRIQTSDLGRITLAYRAMLSEREAVARLFDARELDARGSNRRRSP